MTAPVKPSSPIYPYDLLSLWIVLTSVTGALLLAFSKFNGLVTAGIALLAVLVFSVIMHKRLALKDDRFTRIFFLILGLAFLLRAAPNLYLSGGQDQGYYIMMSKLFNVHGSIDFVDSFRAGLTQPEKDFFDGRASSLYSGVMQRDADRSINFVGFYPLHGMWLAVFGDLLGSDHRPYEMVFWGLISITSLFLLALDLLPGRRRIAYLFALFLAISPLHAFFSKFPVTEIAALGLTSTAFLYLVRLWRSLQQDRSNWLYFSLSLGAFASFFLTRMTGLLYIPFIYLLAVITFLFEPAQKTRLILALYFSCWFGLFVLTCYYYNAFYRDVLFLPTFNDLLSRGLGENFQMKSAAILIFMFLSPPLLRILPSAPFVQRWYRPVLGYTFALILIFGVYTIFKLINPDADATWTEPQKVFLDSRANRAPKYSPIISLFMLLSPLSFAALCALIFGHKSTKNFPPVLFIVAAFFLAFFSVHILFAKFDYYWFYYVRYHVTEIFPSAALLVATTLILWLESSRPKLQRFAKIGLGISVVWSLVPSIYQAFAQEGAERNFYKDIANYIDPKKDLILESGIYHPREIVEPLKQYYQYNNILRLGGDTKVVEQDIVKGIMRRYAKTFLITKTEPSPKERFAYITTLNFRYNFLFNRYRHLYSGTFDGEKDVTKIEGLPFKFLIPTTQVQKNSSILLYEVLPQ